MDWLKVVPDWRSFQSRFLYYYCSMVDRYNELKDGVRASRSNDTSTSRKNEIYRYPRNVGNKSSISCCLGQVEDSDG